MHTTFSELSSVARGLTPAKVSGTVAAITGLSLTVAGMTRAMGIGQRCRVHGARGPILGEVVGIDEQGTHVLPFGTWDGVAAGDRVELSKDGAMLRPDDSWIGRVVDALGQPLDGAGHLHEGNLPRQVKAAPPSAFARRRVGAKLDTGIKCFDIFTPLCRGQRMGVFAGSGVGKSSLMAMLARRAEADVIVVGLVGERGREVQDFIQEDLGAEGMARAVLVVSTGDEPPLMRRQAAWTATAVAEHFRDQGKQVLLMIDSVTRFAMAQREIGLSGGEPPTSKGYPPTVFSELPQLLERAGPGTGTAGDITGLYTVLVDGDDMNEPVADTVRGILDGHVVLDRAIAERGRYPAVNLQKSISRMLPDCHNAAEYAVLQAARRVLAKYGDMEELIRIGAYRPGTDAETDAAMRFHAPAEAFLSQRKHESMPADQSFAEIYQLLGQANVDVVLPKVPAAG
ncbi:flagellar protein export ATPase FliI [Profundibacterium mesophilum]|uniref:Flagellum-specific ATP synthase n=1 Tax=Profundibacterium mesophilum KAUST100406-0324 TaxID=1037889 RepID=A0A921NNX2_9RHOB|nr:flagellar protein export ATPase FliI [Profundibacterium mesophilum]KAF0674617.1 Flagellum-specific ATP synthase [Profundibacterium mesophilum KAUST100406-0324]